MRTYGRIGGNGKWVVISTNADGDDTAVWLATLAQVILLNLNESPFFAQYGIPAKPAVIQQLFPDLYVARTQQQFSSHFASLIITRRQTGPGTNPIYDVAATTKQGVKLGFTIASW